MRIVEATDRSVSILLDTDEEAGKPAELVRRALRHAGLRPWPRAEAEVYSAGDETLILARPGTRLFFLFPGLEELLGAAAACPDAPSALYAAPEGYILALSPRGMRPALYEFGQELFYTPDWELYAAQQGLTLLEKDALAALHSYFTS